MAFKLTDKHIDTIKYLASYGHTTAFIARAIGTTPKSLYNLKFRLPRVADALYVSQNDLVKDVKANMFRIAIDGQDKHSATLGMRLLDKYETAESESESVDVDDTIDIKQSILDELHSK